MVDSIGRFPVGRVALVGERKREFLKKTIQKMEQWRDAARINIFQQRRRYKQKVASNQALMRAKKAGRLPNRNPSSKLDNLGFKPRSVHKHELTHSTVSSKPKYSIVKPAERIYGNKWKNFEKEEGDK
jgi:hypothetical protein